LYPVSRTVELPPDCRFAGLPNKSERDLPVFCGADGRTCLRFSVLLVEVEEEKEGYRRKHRVYNCLASSWCRRVNKLYVLRMILERRIVWLVLFAFASAQPRPHQYAPLVVEEGQASGEIDPTTRQAKTRRLALDCPAEVDLCRDELQSLEDECESSESDPPRSLLDILWEIIFGFISGLIRSLTGSGVNNCADDLAECNNSVENFECSTAPGAPIPTPTFPPFDPMPQPSPVAEPPPMPQPSPVVEPPPMPQPMQITTFYAIGDVPYTEDETTKLILQMVALPTDGAFMVHVGDIRKDDDKDCERKEYSDVASILRLSQIPVFLLPGDNDWTDCPNRVQAFGYWKDEFLNFESRYWNHGFDITHQPGYEENFSFVYQETLFIGLNIVGGSFESFWTERLSDQLEWTIGLIRSFVSAVSPRIGRIVLFAHANPNLDHRRLFFDPLATFIDQELRNRTPFLYINGDGHTWRYQPSFLSQQSFLRIMVSGMATDPPLKVLVQANGERASTADAFLYER